MPDSRKPPPPWLINDIGRIRAGLQWLNRAGVPADLVLFEVAQGAELLSRAGFRQTRVIPTAGPISIVEAVPAERAANA